MTSWLDSLTRLAGQLPGMPEGNTGLALVTAAVVLGVGVFLFMAVNALVAVYAERKISAFMQDRLGPMEVGLFGFKGGKRFWGGIGQTLADALKLVLKEDIIPAQADRKLFILGPFILFGAAFLAFIGLPVGYGLVISDFNIGVFYVTAISSVGVIGIILSGWASNNKWSLYGAMRSAAQIISYELPVGMSLLLVVMVAGSLQFSEIVLWQEQHRWFLVHSPFTVVAFVIFLISGIAEVNRTPFDLPEAESELVAGYMTEYSGFRWAIFFLSEYASMVIISLMAAIVFLGGWLSPVGSLLRLVGVGSGWYFLEGPLWGVFWVFAKVVFLIFVMMWFRWTFPRLRVDQLMYTAWKVFIPFALANIFFVGVWELLFA
ncbi:MAG: NADH-quinone oxidoreductase subunit NuoH [Candidatus Marinimicrobia bacterium]|nr:NADH-quinone oxidoreductase subunit NuoH [Candidatus Neomarinimicrobiota bacterium]